MRAGSYSIRIADKSNIHNFHLTGPGVNKSTCVPRTGTTTWNVRLKKRDLPLRLRSARLMMHGSFTVR